jgi:hypothetical protein
LDGVYRPGIEVDGWDTPPDYSALTQQIKEKYEENAKAMVTTVRNDFPGFVTDATDGLPQKPSTAAAPATSASDATSQQASK